MMWRVRLLVDPDRGTMARMWVTTASAAHVRGQESNARRSISPALFARAVGFELHSFDVVAHSSGRGSHGRGTGCEAPWTAPAIAQNGSRLSRYRDDLVNRDIHSGRWNCYTRSVKTTKIVTYPFFTAVYVPARFASASPTNIGVPDGRGGGLAGNSRAIDNFHHQFDHQRVLPN